MQKGKQSKTKQGTAYKRREEEKAKKVKKKERKEGK